MVFHFDGQDYETKIDADIIYQKSSVIHLPDGRFLVSVPYLLGVFRQSVREDHHCRNSQWNESRML